MIYGIILFDENLRKMKNLSNSSIFIFIFFFFNIAFFDLNRSLKSFNCSFHNKGYINEEFFFHLQRIFH